MSKPSDSKPGVSDPLLILIAALLLLAVGATIFFAGSGPAKEFTQEPPARPRPVVQDEPHVVVVTRAVAGEAAAPRPEAKAAEPKAAVETKTAAPAAVTVAAPAVKATADGRIHGRVLLRGTPPAEKPIIGAKSDVNCGKSHPDAPPTSRNYVVTAGGGLRYALVRVVTAPTGAGHPGAAPLIDQVGCMYEPYVNAVLAGQPFKVRNSDAFMHNVAATPKANKGFNFAQASPGQVNEKQFDQPELAVKLACSVHPWMTCYVHVLENPFFAVTDEKGEFALPDGLPAGKYTLEISHLKAGAVAVEIEVGAGKGAEVAVELGVK